MAFRRGLYYPYIEVHDEGWLKNALLFWEEINTIVPQSIKKPYRTETSRTFQDAGLLTPLFVNPDMDAIRQLADTLAIYLNSTEALAIFGAENFRYDDRININKLPREFQQLVRLHPEKLSDELAYKLRGFIENYENDEWLNVPSAFGDYYMTILAEKLAGMQGFEPVTNSSTNNSLSNRVKAGNRALTTLSYDDHYMGRRHNRDRRRLERLAQGIMLNMLMNNFAVPADTPEKQIVEFRRAHGAELEEFRCSVDELFFLGDCQDMLDSDIRNMVERRYKRVTKAISGVEKSLRGVLTRGLVEGVMGIACIAIPGALTTANFFSGSPVLPLGLWSGLCLTASLIIYDINKERALANSPYSYLYRLKKEFTY